MIYTSYYSRVKKLKEAGITPISISVGKPKWWKGESIGSLAPRWDMLKMSEAEYNVNYHAILAKNDARHIAEDLIGDRDVALLCYEADINKCHRKMVGEWLRRNGYACTEWQPSIVKIPKPEPVIDPQMALF